MSERAFQLIRAWRRHIKDMAIEAGAVPPSGAQNSGHDHLPLWKAIAMTRAGTCQVYNGQRLPKPESYLTVEVHIGMLGLGPSGSSNRLAFERFVYERLRTGRSLASKRVNKRHAELGRLLVKALSEPDVLHMN